MYYHATSGLNLTKYRAYNPNLGRWISRDPSGEGSGLNLYAYCGNNPICNVDPLGLSFWSSFGSGLVNGAIGAAVIVGGAALVVAIAPEAAVAVTGVLFVGAVVGGAAAIISVINNPSADNVGYNLGALTGSAIVGGVGGKGLATVLSPEAPSPTTLTSEITNRWIDPDNPNSLAAGIANYLQNFNKANATGPTSTAAAGSAAAAATGAANAVPGGGSSPTGTGGGCVDSPPPIQQS